MTAKEMFEALGFKYIIMREERGIRCTLSNDYNYDNCSVIFNAHFQRVETENIAFYTPKLIQAIHQQMIELGCWNEKVYK